MTTHGKDDTDSDYASPPKTHELLREMDAVHMILDVTHLADQAFWQAVELFHGPVLASHHNCRALFPVTAS